MHEVLLKPSEVAAMFGVSAKTVSRWAHTGRVPYVRTVGGHFRFRVADVEAVLARNTVNAAPTVGLV